MVKVKKRLWLNSYNLVFKSKHKNKGSNNTVTELWAYSNQPQWTKEALKKPLCYLEDNGNGVTLFLKESNPIHFAYHELENLFILMTAMNREDKYSITELDPNL